MFGEVVDDVIRIYAWILFLLENLRRVIRVFAGQFIDALIGAISDVHEIFKSEAWFAEVLVSLITTILSYV